MATQPAARNEVFGDFGLPKRPSTWASHAGMALAVAALLCAAGSLGVTQWLARALAYQPALGQPWLKVGDTSVFAPWAALGWLQELERVKEGAVLVQQARGALSLVGLLSLCVGGLVCTRRLKAARNRAAELHGSARWAMRDEIERAGLLSAQGVVAGKWVDKRAGKVRYLRHAGPEHVLVFAPTGSGKGVGLVLPTLLTWAESALVLDPKGENFAKTSGYRQSVGQRVLKLDFAAAPSETAAFNPLSAVRLGTSQETADAQRVARLIVDPDGRQFEGQNRHWAETAASLLTGALLHVLYRERLRGRCATLADVVRELSCPERSHVEVLEDWLSFAHDPGLTQGWQAGGVPTATHPAVVASAREQLNREDRERSAVLSSAVAPLALFRDPLLAANTSRSDFSIEQLMDDERPMTVYFVLRPDDVQRLRPIVRIMLDLMLRRLVQTMSFVDGEGVTTHKHKLLLMLDEFPVLGKLEVFSESLAYIRGWGIRAYLICQDYEQLRASYGDRETISSNCQLKLAYAPNKLETAKLLSQMTGTTTMLMRARSRGLALGAASNRGSESEQEVSRPLLTPDECMRLPGPRKRGSDIVEPGDMLVFFAGMAPVYAQQPLFFKDPELLRRARMAPASVGRLPGNVDEPPAAQAPPPASAAGSTHDDVLDEELLSLGRLASEEDALDG